MISQMNDEPMKVDFKINCNAGTAISSYRAGLPPLERDTSLPLWRIGGGCLDLLQGGLLTGVEPVPATLARKGSAAAAGSAAAGWAASVAGVAPLKVRVSLPAGQLVWA